MDPFPTPRPDDPDYIFENAMFRALADPAARHILEILRQSPGSLPEITAMMGGFAHKTLQWLDALEATKLIAKDAQSKVYRLDSAGLGRLTDFALRFSGGSIALKA